MKTLGILAIGVVAVAMLAPAQRKYSGPRPPKPDVPYLMHATNLIETESGEAKEEESKDWKTYLVSGATSPARTPLAEPIFLMQAEKLVPDKMSLYQVTAKNGRREVAFPTNPKKTKDAPKPFRLALTRLEPGLFRLEVNVGSGLESGEYCLTPDGSNQVFCFTVY
jgi:hypothetical protein